MQLLWSPREPGAPIPPRPVPALRLEEGARGEEPDAGPHVAEHSGRSPDVPSVDAGGQTGVKRELSVTIPNADRIDAALSWARSLIEQGLARGPVVLRLTRPRRSLDQNAKLWALLTDVSRQVEWYGERLTAEEWKDVFTAAQKRQRTVPGIDGGFVVLGAHTSRMTVVVLSELLELIQAFGAERGVQWSDEGRAAA